MSEVRVFELAKELKMPAKQLLSKMRKAGIPVTGNFSEMSVEQAEIVREMAKSAKGIIVPESVKRTTIRQKKPSEKTAAETDLPEKSKKVKASKIVTISTKSKSDEEEVEESPKRRVRRKKTDSQPSIKEDDSESEIIKNLESDNIGTVSKIKTVPANSLAKKKEFLNKSNDLEFQKKESSLSKPDKSVDKNIVEFPQEIISPQNLNDGSSENKLADEGEKTDDSVQTSDIETAVNKEDSSLEDEVLKHLEGSNNISQEETDVLVDSAENNTPEQNPVTVETTSEQTI